MKRVFLSHSSKQKEGYLRPLVKKLQADRGKERFVYDEETFEEGLKNDELITSWLEKTDLFVLFISDEALESPWVRKEIFEAKELQKSGYLNKIYPIIIDARITHEDSRIPDWMRKQYNLRLISKPSVAARKIISRMTEISWEKNPKLKEIQQLFVGRNDLMQELEVRLDSFDKIAPNTLIATGMNSMGRRTFLKKGLTKLNFISESYSLPTIKLDAHQSIEDFILLINDFGIAGVDISTFNLMTMKQVEKINLAVQMLIEINDAKDILLIIDDGAIVSPIREISKWFLEVNKAISSISSDIYMCVVSKYRTNVMSLFDKDYIYSLHVPELSLSERKGLLKRYSKLINMQLELSDMNYISSFFSGLPEEIIYTCDVIKENGVGYIKGKTELISDYSDRKVSRIISIYEDNEEAKSLLSLIALFDFVSSDMLKDIIGEDAKYLELLNDFFAQGICDNIGSNGEYLVLNSAIKNYVSRQRIPLTKKFKKGIQDHVKDFVVNYEENDEGRDVADVFFSLKESLILGEDLNTHMLIPSHYLKSMKELYDKRNSDSEVIKLADAILEQEEFMDDHIIREIRYFLCSSLARMKDDRFKSEVQSISGAEHNFLFGFYYRHVGKDEEAADRLNKALLERPRFSRAKRELVTVYNSLDEYDKAYELARENYEENRSNEYHIQAYFQALSSMRNLKMSNAEKKYIMNQLLEDMNKIESEKAKNMYLIMYAKYYLYVEEDIEMAITYVEEANEDSPDNMYVLLCQFDIYEKANDLDKLGEVIKAIENNIKNSRSKYFREFKKCQALYQAKIGNISNARSIAKSSYLPENSKQILLARIDKMVNL